MLAGFHAIDEHFRTAPFEQNLPVLLGLIGIWYDDFFGAETPGDPAVQPVPRALPRLPPAARHGERRQVGRPSTATRSTMQTGPIVWGQPGHQRPARLLPAHPPGHEAHPVRLHRVRARRTTRSATTRTCSWPTCSRRPRRSRSARRARRSRPRACPRTRCRTARSPGNHPTNTILVDRAHAVHARPARRALRAQGVHPGHDLEHQLVRPVGRRAGQEARARTSSRSSSRGRRAASSHARLVARTR